MKIFFAFLGIFVFLRSDSQNLSRPLHTFTISKGINNQNKIVFKYIEIDSSGKVYVGKKLTEDTIDIKKFCAQVNKYVSEEKFTIYPGNNDISVIEPGMPKFNEQIIVITVTFLDDFRNEKNLRNKTYYSWGKSMDKSIKDYPFYKFFSEPQKKILKSLLE